MLEANRFNLADTSPKHLTDLYLLGLAISSCTPDDLIVLPGNPTEDSATFN